jgi:hypothetical protein
VGGKSRDMTDERPMHLDDDRSDPGSEFFSLLRFLSCAIIINNTINRQSNEARPLVIS